MTKKFTFKKIHQGLLLLVCFVCTLSSWAEDYTENGVIYDINTSTKTATVKGLEDKSATSAEIKSNVAECKVTGIGESAFSDCSSLASINIPNSVTSFGHYAFNLCNSLTEINIPNSVTSIGSYAFKGCKSLTSINIPSSVNSIDIGAFIDCGSLTSFTVEANNPNFCAEGPMLYNKNKTTLICAVGNQKTYDIPSSVTSIGFAAFFDHRSLTTINIPNSVKSIGASAFAGCSSLVTINIPNSVNSIGSSAFQGCSSLTTINIPKSVNNIEYATFWNCNSLTTINIPNSVKSIDYGAFFNCNSLTKINIPNSVKTIGESAFWGCFSLTTINIPNSVTSIGDRAFQSCSSLTSIDIPSSVTNIGYSAFQNCSSLTSINNLSSVNNIGDYTFSGCHSLTIVNIPNSVKSIGEFAFYDCSSLKTINIPNSVNRIGYQAFSNCSSLKTIVLQSERILLDESVFKDCGSVYTISDNFEIILENKYQQGSCVDNFLGGTWHTCGIPTILDNNGSAISSDLWSGSLFDNNTAQYLRTISQTSTNAQKLISKHNVIYNNLPENLRKTLEDNLQKVDWANIITADNDALSVLSTNLSKAYKDVYDVVYNQLNSNSKLDMLYAKAADFSNPYLTLLPTYTTGSNILTSAEQLSTNKPEEDKGPISNLVDGDKYTFFHSTWTTPNENNAYAYLQIDLKGTYKDLLLDYTKRYNFRANKGYPIQFHVFATNTPNDEESWKNCGYSNLLRYNYDNQQNGQTILTLDANYQYIRLQVEKTGDMVQNNGNLYFSLGELAIYPITSYKEAPYTEKDGLITDASQLSSNAVEPTEGSLAALIDNNLTTYFHSTWTQNNATGAKHYLQVDLNDAYKQIALKYSKRQLNADDGTPVTLHVYATNTPEDANSWTDLGTQTCNYDYDSGNTGLLPLNFGDTAYRHIRLMVEETTEYRQKNGNLFFYWSELHAYTRASKTETLTEATRTALTSAMQQAKAELDAKKATDATYATLEAAYNTAKNEVSEETRLVDFAKSFYLTSYSDQALVVPTGVKAAVVTANGESIRNDYRYNSGDVIPAETGVLLKSGKGNSFYLSASESTEMAPEDNLLHGTLNDEMTNVVGADKYYKLSYDRATGTEIGFYWGAANGGAFMNKGGKAFLAIPATLQAAQLTGFSLFDLDNNQAITGIEHATTTPAATLRVYDLNGRRINVNHVDELPQGIYVINGKKVIR